MSLSRGRKRIAVICLAHSGNPAGVLRLARYFAGTPSHVYLHVDAKTDIAPYRSALEHIANVTFAHERAEVFWCGFSVVQAIMTTLAGAWDEHAYERYCLISEDSAPLLERERFTALMAESCEYMYLGQYKQMMRRYTDFCYLDSMATNPRSTQDERVLTPSVTAAVERLEALRARGKVPIARLFHGPGWWAITARAAYEILLHHAQSDHLRESFEFSFIPDEQYFHTILGNAARRFEFRPFMWSDFDREPRPYIVRTGAELVALRSAPFLFARNAALDSADVENYFAALT